MKTRYLIALLLTAIIGYLAFTFVQYRESIAYEQGIDEMVWAVSTCTLEMAHADQCSIPCTTDSDCMQKNGKTDH